MRSAFRIATALSALLALTAPAMGQPLAGSPDPPATGAAAAPADDAAAKAAADDAAAKAAQDSWK
jgi:hypothetical protein